MKRSSALAGFLIPAITLFAFWLRVYALSSQSYWLDEAWTLYFAGISLTDLWHWLRTEELHPPLYFPLINFWVRLAGNSEFSTRFISVIFSTMTIPLTYRLGRALGSGWVGIITALLVAIAPYQIWHGQDARNYSMLTAAATMSMWSFVIIMQNQKAQGSWWLLYILSTIWTIMTHYHGLVIIGIQGLFLLVTFRQRGPRVLAWAAAVAAVLLPLALWLSVGPNLLASSHWLTLVSLPASYWRGAVAYSVGELLPAPQNIYLALPFLLLYGIGLVYASLRQWGKWQGWELLVFLLAFTLAPNVAAWVYGLLRTPVYLERYLIPVQIGFLLTLAIGLQAIYTATVYLAKRLARQAATGPLHRRVGIGLTVIVFLVPVSISGWVLSQYYFNPAFARPDWRAVAHKVAAFEQAGDGIIITGDNGDKAFNYYYTGTAPLYLDFNTPTPTPDEARLRLAEISNNHQRLWFSPYGAPIDPVLEAWLRANAYPAWQSWLGRKRLALYYVGEPTIWRGGLRLTRPSLMASPWPEIRLPDHTIAAGELLPMELIWHTDRTLPANPQLSVRLINDQSDIFAQSDWPPINAGDSATEEQSPVDRRSLWLPAELPPGNYLLQLLVYDPATGQPVGAPVMIRDIAVGATDLTPPMNALDIPNVTPAVNTEGAISLVGYAGPEMIQPGQMMWLWLHWLANQDVSPETRLTVSLGNKQSTLETTVPITAVSGPTDQWLPGQIRRGVLHIPTSPHLQGDRADLTVTVEGPAQKPALFQAGTVTLLNRERVYDTPEMDYPVDVNLGNPALTTLPGVDMPLTLLSGGDVLPVTIFWQPRSEFKTNYTVFLQLLDPTGQVVAQIDAQPQNGAAATVTWLPGEVITDPYSLPLPSDLPPGEYQLITGLYNPLTGTRLQMDNGKDFVELPTVTVR
jgi:4-amino-4-deoxy-L-arabinose transferase-like glycosyltransferase